MRKLLLLALLLLPVVAHADYTFLTSACNGSADNYEAAVEINTTGATLLVVALTSAQAATENVVSDEGVNSWTSSLTRSCVTAGACVRVHYVNSATPTALGAGHEFVAESTFPTVTFPTICVLAFSGSHATPFDQQNDESVTAATSVQPGSVTPSENDEVVISAIGLTSGIATGLGIDAPFSTPVEEVAGANNYHGAISYVIQTTATAADPTWSWTGNDSAGSVNVTFKEAAGAGGALPRARVR